MKMRAQLEVFILLLIVTWKRGSCIIRNAVEGVDTNIVIQCGRDRQMAAPFWRINDHVYDIFHIPAYFRVESYTGITIPEVSQAFNDYTFQCVLIDYMTNQIREIQGITTILTVNENTINDGVPTLVPRDLLELDYQQFRVDSDNITIGWIYSISDCDISHFTLEGFERGDVLTNSLQEPTLVHNSTTNIVSIPLRNNSGLYFRLSSFGENGELCGQDTKSQQIFYNLHITTETHRVVYGGPGETVCVPIPDNFTDGEMTTPVFVWPANPDLPGDCYCPPYENVELTKFSDCVVTCNTTYSIESVNESICFSNFTFSMNNTQVYFVTLTDQCDFPDCFIRTTVASYRIIIIGYPEQPVIFYSNNSLCFSAYSDPRYPVLSYTVNITTQSGTNMTTLNSSHHCFSLPGDLFDSCEAFTVSATSSNAIGTSNITEFQSEGIPCAPRISYINNSICFFPHSTFQYPVNYYDVNVTDITGLQTSLTGTYRSSQCLPIICEPYPNVCRPFQVMATATNAYGTSNVTTYNSTTDNRPEEPPTGCDCYQKRVSAITCYSSRSCHGNLVKGDIVSSGKAGCCMNGGVLSFKDKSDGICHECFSEKTFETEGNKFYFGFFDNLEQAAYFQIDNVRLAVIPIVGSQTSFELNYLGNTRTYSTPVDIEIEGSVISIDSDRIRDRAVVVKSVKSDPLSVVAYVEEFISSDAYKVLPSILLPVETYEYYAVSVPRAKMYDYDDGTPNEGEYEEVQDNSAIVIVTSAKETLLNITLTQTVTITAEDLLQQIPGGEFTAGNAFIVKLPNQAQTLYIASENDLTGSRVTSNKPISFISGHECGNIPEGINYCDQLVEQIPPTATWGKTFILRTITGRTAYDIIKVLASLDCTDVTVSCTNIPFQTFNISKGEYKNVNVSSNNSCFFSSTRPILLVQFSVASNIDGVFQGDPLMVIIPPIEQYRSSYSISILLPSHQFSHGQLNFINIMVPVGVNPSGLRLNGTKLKDSTIVPLTCGNTPCGNTVLVSVPEGQSTLTHSDPSATFGATVYWLAFRTGCGYFAGMTQKPIAMPRISFNESSFVVFENQSFASISLTIRGEMSVGGSVQFDTRELTSDNAAIVSEDFEGVSQKFEFLPNESNLIITIPLVNDIFPEETEEFEIFLSSSPGVFIDSPAYARVVILNDDPDLEVMNVSFAAVSIEADEGDFTINLQLDITEGALGPVSVQIFTVSGTARDGDDYIPLNEVITFDIDDDLQQSVAIFILDNSIAEDVESFSVSISPIPGLFPVAVQNSTATISIKDNDLVVIGFSQRHHISKESEEVVNVTVTVQEGVLNKTVTILLITSDGTAKSRSDYFEERISLTFDSSTNSHTVSIPIVNDDLVEGDEFFTCLLSVDELSSTNIVMLQNEAVVIILDTSGKF